MKTACGLAGALLLVATATGAKDKEFTALPVAGGDSDIGFGVGYIASYARFAPDREPYVLRLESAGAVSYLPDETSPKVSYIDEYLLLELPHLVPHRLELAARVSFTRATTLKFYGLGNASVIDPGREPSDDHYEYARTYPAARLRATYHATPVIDLNWGLAYEYDWLEIPEEGELAQTLANGTEQEKLLLGDTRNGSVVTFLFGAALDSRDDEVSPHRGHFHELRVELAPGGPSGIPHRWGRSSALFRVFVPIVPSRLTFAARAVGDLMFGDVPFYELSRFDGSSAIGGLKGVRGVPANRYYGKIKLFGNAELRSELFSAHFWGKKNTFGLTGFFDAGRVFADYAPSPELDGTGLGLKYGTGGGLRLAAGDSFVLRFDVAWSPDADPVGAYLTSGHVF
ncbi:MAG TPA: BamA/TamA family outer membrane protein [Polyangiaceae bacterium]